MGAGMLTFIVIGGVGLAYFLISLLLGEIGGGEAEVGQADVDVSGPEAEAGSATETASSDPSWLSPRILAAGAFGFGLFGACASSYGVSPVFAVLIAIAGLAAMAAGVYYLIARPMARSESNTLIGRQSYIGREARVILPIPPNGVGQVVFTNANGATVHEMARSHGITTTIPNGTGVMIAEVGNGEVYVTQLNTYGSGVQA